MAKNSKSNDKGDDVTKEELYEKAQELDIEGRSDMNKDELAAAVEKAEKDGGSEKQGEGEGEAEKSSDGTAPDDPAQPAGTPGDGEASTVVSAQDAAAATGPTVDAGTDDVQQDTGDKKPDLGANEDAEGSSSDSGRGVGFHRG